jgi:hypothetical protein
MHIPVRNQLPQGRDAKGVENIIEKLDNSLWDNVISLYVERDAPVCIKVEDD